MNNTTIGAIEQLNRLSTTGFVLGTVVLVLITALLVRFPIAQVFPDLPNPRIVHVAVLVLMGFLLLAEVAIMVLKD